MQVEQFVMAYGVEQDRLRSILPQGFKSLRPVLRFNAEILEGKRGYLELNTAVELGEFRGWLNVGFWKDVPFSQKMGRTLFHTEALDITFTRTGVVGSCPAERDNDGCYFLREDFGLRQSEVISSEKEFCHCVFQWSSGTGGQSIGETLPAIPEKVRNHYPLLPFTIENAAAIPCRQVLGAYAVKFERSGENYSCK